MCKGSLVWIKKAAIYANRCYANVSLGAFRGVQSSSSFYRLFFFLSFFYAQLKSEQAQK